MPTAISMIRGAFHLRIISSLAFPDEPVMFFRHPTVSRSFSGMMLHDTEMGTRAYWKKV